MVAPPVVGGAGLPFLDHFSLTEMQDEKWQGIADAWAAGLHPAVERDTKEFDQSTVLVKDVYGEDRTARLMQFVYEDGGMAPLVALWAKLLEFGDQPVVHDGGLTPPAWWEMALKVMILADMASSGVGFRAPHSSGTTKPRSLIQARVLEMAAEAAKAGKPFLTTICSSSVDGSMCAVLPKTRTSSLGCTLRALTHNLALLPSPGLVQARWRIPGQPPKRAITGQADDPTHDNDTHSMSLNLLLVPFPYRFSSHCFSPMTGVQDFIADAKQSGKNCWGFYEIEQLWLHKEGKAPTATDNSSLDSRNEFTSFVSALKQRAAQDLGAVHAVLFPEYSLNADYLEALSQRLFLDEAKRNDLEFLIAGLSESPVSAQNQDRVRGNFAVVRGRHESGQDIPLRWRYNDARQKHHRWKLDRGQIERYGLTERLDPAAKWWEGIPLGQRHIDFFEPRAGTSMTVMICEDLARADPVQTVIRSIGPNLVIALLMDGPQRRGRWPSNYAGVLADDPGCAVLTFTSLALIHRSSATDTDQSRTIAFFKNSTGNVRELNLPVGFHALALRLCAHKKTESTLDGRPDGNSAYVWELREVTPVRAPADQARDWIIYGT